MRRRLPLMTLIGRAPWAAWGLPAKPHESSGFWEKNILRSLHKDKAGYPLSIVRPAPTPEGPPRRHAAAFNSFSRLGVWTFLSFGGGVHALARCSNRTPCMEAP